LRLYQKQREKLCGTKETKNYMQIYGGVTKQALSHAGIMIVIHKSLKYKVDNHKYWNERIIEVRIKTF
jgi:hypothetical protein